MGILDMFRRKATASGGPRAEAFNGLDDPAFLDWIRSGGNSISVQNALRNSAVFRCVDLISGTIGSLPLYMRQKDAKGQMVEATDHPLHTIFRYRPNPWQTAFEFKQLNQFRLLVDGNAYNRIVRTGKRISALIPINGTVQVEQTDDWTFSYRVTNQKGVAAVLPASEVFHLKGLSLDGFTGLSRVAQAADVINTAVMAQRAAERIFRRGILAGGALEHPGKLSPEAAAKLKAQMENDYSGVENAGKWMVFEEGMKGQPWQATAQSSQLSETRAAQVEEIARVFGVPRPLMGVDDTSWGSGIEQLAILFVRFGLSPWFTVWEDAINRSLLDRSEWGQILPDFDEKELLRGTLKDQAEYFAKALGSGGHKPWMESNEVREATGLGPHNDGFGLVPAGGVVQ